jgi:uncharacterized membrane-anchored protein
MKFFLWLGAVLTATVFAQEPELASAPETERITPEQFIAALKPQRGEVTLPGGVASLNLPSNYQYLSPESTETLLVDAWGNPPGNPTLGMIIPTASNPLERGGWGVVITYDEDGYVSDDDAADINYDELLQQMKDGNKEENQQRVDAGYSEFQLTGWAEPPRYDAQNHKLHWALEFATPGQGEHSLNYNIRVLGREGVLVLNAVAGVEQLATIRDEMPTLLAITEFTPGKRYEEFDASTDKVAEYGLAALVAGGVAAKLGMFAKIGALLLAFKKALFFVGAAVVSVLARRFGKKKNDSIDA